MEAIAAVLSALLALVLAVSSFIGWRRSELRREEVHEWANRAISALQSLQLICMLNEESHKTKDFGRCADELVFETSILIEQGRLFFRNIVRDNFGSEKPKAYKGYRPEVLDHLVVGHQIACTWRSADAVRRIKMGRIAADRLRRFVSAMQAEVGRSRTASEDTEAAGFGVNIEALLSQISSEDVKPLRHL